MNQKGVKLMTGSLVRAAAFGSALVASTMTAGVASADDPLMGKAPWNFTPQNRAAIAVAIKNAEDGNGGGGVAGGGGTTVLCGGTSGGAQGDASTGAGASATANSTCVIVTNSDGAIVDVDQASDGDQSAGAQSDSKNTQASNSSGSIDEVAAILGGKKQ